MTNPFLVDYFSLFSIIQILLLDILLIRKQQKIFFWSLMLHFFFNMRNIKHIIYHSYFKLHIGHLPSLI